MKTISVSAGKGVKSTPVSLSKAAKYLRKFVESDSGASEANLGFLKRASAAFDELNAFHKEIKKVKSRRLGGVDVDENVKSGSIVIADDEKKHKKKENKKDDESHVNHGEVDVKKRKKLEAGDEGRIGDSDERKLKKKRKINREEHDE